MFLNLEIDAFSHLICIQLISAVGKTLTGNSKNLKNSLDYGILDILCDGDCDFCFSPHWCCVTQGYGTQTSTKMEKFV
jgi:hypothetical protein